MFAEGSSPSLPTFNEYILFIKIIAYLLLNIFLERHNNSSNKTEHSKKIKKVLTNERKYDIIQK